MNRRLDNGTKIEGMNSPKSIAPQPLQEPPPSDVQPVIVWGAAFRDSLNTTNCKEKACSKCGKLTAHSQFYKDARTKDGLFSSCILCMREAARNYWHKTKHLRDVGKDREARRLRGFVERRKHADRRMAVKKLARAVKKGIIHPRACEVCGISKAEAHHDDYSKPLAVRWLCRFHHLEHHKAERVKALRKEETAS